MYSHLACPCSLELCFLHRRQPTSPDRQNAFTLCIWLQPKLFEKSRPAMLHELDVKEQEIIIGGSRAPLFLSDAC